MSIQGSVKESKGSFANEPSLRWETQVRYPEPPPAARQQSYVTMTRGGGELSEPKQIWICNAVSAHRMTVTSDVSVRFLRKGRDVECSSAPWNWNTRLELQ